MSEAASHFVPDYRDQPEGSAFWRTDTPEGVRLAAGYVGIKPELIRHAKRMPLHLALNVAFLVGVWAFAGAARPFPWRPLLFATFIVIPALWIVTAIVEGRQGLAIEVLRDGLRVHRQNVLRRGRWRSWRRDELARTYVNWEGYVVLRGPDGKRVGKFGGVPSRTDMDWLARLIRGRLDLSD